MTPSRTLIAYVAGPYRDPRGPYYVDKNIQRARGIAADLWQQGFAALCPHLNTAHFDGLVDDTMFLSGALEMLRRSDLVVLAPDWHLSTGTREEIRDALRHGIPVYGWPNTRTPLGADFFAEMGVRP